MRRSVFSVLEIPCKLSAVNLLRATRTGLHSMATIVKVPSTKEGGKPAYRAQVRVRGRPSESATFPTKAEAKAWATSIESAIREGKHFPHAAAKRTNFDALAEIGRAHV